MKENQSGKILDFRMHTAAWIAMVVAVLSIPVGMYMPESFGYENGVVENMQMVVLALGVYFCFRSNNHRQLFIFAGLVLIMLMLREVNCGRTLFFAKPGEVNSFYKWKEIPYGWVARVVFGLYIGASVLYFFVKKLYMQIWNAMKMVSFPVWNLLLALLGMSLGVYAERCMKNLTIEELAELVFYVSLVGLLHIYARKHETVEPPSQKIDKISEKS